MFAELTAAQLLTMVVDGFVAAGAGKLTEAALSKLKALWQKLRDRLVRRPDVPALPEQPTGAINPQVVEVLEAELVDDPHFAEELRAIAVEFEPMLRQVGLSQTQQQGDRGAVNIEARDNSTVKVVKGSIHAGADVSF